MDTPLQSTAAGEFPRTERSRRLRNLEAKAARWMAKHSTALLRVSLGMVFLAFGALKFFPGLSPAEGLAGETLQTMSFGLLPPAVSLPLLAAGECLIGIGLIFGTTRGGGGSLRQTMLRLTVPAIPLHLLGTAAPLFLSPGEMFAPGSGAALLSLECQYILKNVVLAAAALAVGGQALGSARGQG